MIKNSRFSGNNYILLTLFTLILFARLTLAADPISDKNQLPEIKEKTALAFANFINAKDVDGIHSLFDMKSFGYRVAAGISEKKDFQEGFVSTFATPENSEQFIQDAFRLIIIDQNAIAHYKGFAETPSGKLPFIRIDFANGGHEFMLLKIGAKAKVVDFFFATKGKFTSSVVAQASQLMMQDSDQFLQRIFGGKQVDEDFVKRFKSVIDLRRQGKMLEAYNALRELPDDYQSARFVIDIGILLSQSVSNEEYLNQLEKLDKYFGDEKNYSVYAY